MDNLTIVILAAGMGSRMKSHIPKVCHKVGDMTMIEHVINTSKELNPGQIVVVVSKNNIRPIRKVLQDDVVIRLKIQYGQLGTAHAVLSAAPCCDETTNLLVLLGDTPLIKARTLQKVTRTKYDAVIIGFKNPDLSKPYGRIVIENNRVRRIVEYAEATPNERKNRLSNSGMMWIKKEYVDLLYTITNNNSKGEYYLTDIIEIMANRGLHIGFLEAGLDECMGVNTPEDLFIVNQIYDNSR